MTGGVVIQRRFPKRQPHVALLLPDLRGGGAERVSINLANELVARGYSVDMVVMRAAGKLMPLLDPKVRVVDLGAARMRGVFLPLVRYLRETQPSSLLACMWPLTVIASCAASSSKTRLVVVEHTTLSVAERSRDRFHNLILKTTMRLLFPRADGVVAVSQGAADDLAGIAQLPRERVVAIYNPIVGGAKAARTEEIPESLDWSNGPHHKILAVGTLKAIKDYATLLQAFALLRRNVEARLLILGEGEERGRLEQMIQELGIGADVCLPGYVSSTEAYFQMADLHVLSSVGEGLPTVIVEAMEQGVPVVSTDCPSGPREILDNGRYGALVPVSDPNALARAMQDALMRTHDTAALKARAADFSVGKAADAYLDLLLPGWRQSPLRAEAHE